jgi:hypothetical protein
MEGISDIKIIGIDEMRPPLSRKEPYINIYFKLAHKAPADWCDRFNRLVSKMKYTTKIESSEGLFIETWMRNPDEIQGVLNELKAAVKACTEAYIERVRLEVLDAATGGGVNREAEGEQGRLNRIIAGLNYDD